MAKGEAAPGVWHRPRPLSEGLVDRVCLAFALWTVCSHAVVLLGGNLLLLILLGGLGAATALVFGHRLWPESISAPLVLAVEHPDSRWQRGLRKLALGVGPVAVLATFWSESTVALWWCLVLVLGAASVPFLLRQGPSLAAPARGLKLEIGLALLTFLCITVALFSHRPDIDDAFYINLAATAADFPAEPILYSDTLHGVADLPIHLAVYKVHSFEMLSAAISYLTGIPALYVFHVLLAIVGAVLLPLAFARLFRILTPAHWLWAVAALLVILLATGEVHRWYGNFALVRMWQGKSFYLFVFLPLIYAYGMRFALRPSVGGWVLLWAAQVAAVGCSSTAVWAGPAAALMALCIGLPLHWRGLRILCLGALSTLYSLAVGWLIKPTIVSTLGQSPPDYEPGYKLYGVMAEILGEGRLCAFGAVVLLSVWACWGPGMGRRFAIGLPLMVGVVLLNPYTFLLVKKNLTGPAYWRGMWSLPLPIMMVLLLIAPLSLDRGRLGWLGSRALCVAALAAFAWFVPSFGALTAENDVTLGLPGAKAPALFLRLARDLNQAVPAGSMVVAPQKVSIWVPVLQHHAYPMMVRRTYLERFRRHLGSRETDDRILMTRFVSGGRVPDLARERFAVGLDLYAIQGVCIRRNRRNSGIRQLLHQRGFRRHSNDSGFEIWVRLAES